MTVMDRIKNNIDKVANINLKKLFYRFTILGLILTVITFVVINLFLQDSNLGFFESFLVMSIVYQIFLGVLLIIFYFKFLSFLIDKVSGKGKSDFFKSKEIETKEVIQKATQKKAKDLEEDLFS